MNISEEGLELIKGFEGLRLEAYPDPATGGDPWTIGYGSTGPDVVPGLTITEEEAEDRLLDDLETFEQCVETAVGPHVNDAEFSACVSLAFNIGCNNFRTSTLVKMIRAGNMAGASEQFMRWTKAAGRVMPGLVRRRQAEKELFLS